jgi:glutamine amidotransferase-like uncharacterized protein
MSKAKGKLSGLHLLTLIAVVFLSLGCASRSANNPGYTLEQGESGRVTVGLYIDYSVWDGCGVATQAMLKVMKCEYTVIRRDDVVKGELSRFSVLLMPGGDMWKYAASLGSQGMEAIRDYVRRGGGYIGICGGAYFAATTIVWRGWADQPRIYTAIKGLGFFPGTADGPIEDFAPSYTDERCKVRIVDALHQATRGLPETIELFYSHGPSFLADADAVTVLGKSVRGDKAVIIALQNGLGRVFLTGFHPENDATRATWAMVKNAIMWCGRKSG